MLERNKPGKTLSIMWGVDETFTTKLNHRRQEQFKAAQSFDKINSQYERKYKELQMKLLSSKRRKKRLKTENKKEELCLPRKIAPALSFSNPMLLNIIRIAKRNKYLTMLEKQQTQLKEL